MMNKISFMLKKYYKKIKKFLLINQDVKILLFSLFFIFFVSVIFHHIERQYNEGFISFLDAVWWTIVSMSTVGYGDISPITPTGKVIAMFVLFLGVALVGIITGKITSFLVEKRLKEGKGLGEIQYLKNHFIVCGWTDNMEQFLIDILKVNSDLSSDNLVLINSRHQDEVASLKTNNLLHDLYFIFGDFVEEGVLVRANIKNASRIIVLADVSMANSPEEVDSRTVMAVMTIDVLNKNIYSCAELFDPKYKRHLEISHCNEIILSKDYNRMIMTNASSATGIPHVVSNLLDVNSKSRMLCVNFPKEFISKTFHDLKNYFNEYDGTLLIGILENAGNIFFQKKEALREAQKTPDITKIVANLKNVKNIIANMPVINPNPNYILKNNSKAIIIEPSFIV